MRARVSVWALGLLMVFTAVAPAQQAHRRRRTTHHANPTQLRSKLQSVRSEKAKVRQELRKARQAAHEVKEEIQIVDARLERIEDELDRTSDRLSANQSEQKSLAQRLTETTQRLGEVREQVRRRLRKTYLRPGGTFVSALIGARSVTDLVSRQQIVLAVARRDHQMFDEYRRLEKEVAEKKQEQDRLVASIRDLKERQLQHQDRLEGAREEKHDMLQGLQSKQERLKKLLAQFESDEADIASQIAAFARRNRQPGSRPLPPMSGRFLRPANGPITSTFGMRYHPILHYRRLHAGVDIGARSGSPIYAAADGEVISARYSSSYGNVIIIAHSGGLTTLYAHCSRLMVSSGQMVHRGQRIGSVGATGLAAGPHLHWEVRVNGRPVNPLGF